MSILSQYIEQALIGKSKKTLKTYRTQLEKFNQLLVESDTSLDDGLTRVDVQSYISYRQRPQSEYGQPCL
ncbi:site-specific integrase [Alicyclobacillus tolerans]|uniref:site-specific integrase n=1 Tax=Alicyclobacillus tolerans TaxID=90970 RepID=UPI003B80C9CF